MRLMWAIATSSISFLLASCFTACKMGFLLICYFQPRVLLLSHSTSSFIFPFLKARSSLTFSISAPRLMNLSLFPWSAVSSLWSGFPAFILS